MTTTAPVTASDGDLTGPLTETGRSNWLRGRTLVTVRWAAIIGQIGAILVATHIYGFEIEVGLASLAIGASILLNLFVGFLWSGARRLSGREAALMLIFDVAQLGLLLFLTGGLTNPFVVLILAPVAIAAAVLPLRSTVVVVALAIGVVTAIAVWSLPISTGTEGVLDLPGVFRFGFWIALLIGILFLSIYARQVTTEIHGMREALVATQLALAREQKLTDLGGVVAAAAHELGTPLATIKLVSSEMVDMLGDRPDLREDAELIHAEADRCRDILRSMGRAGKDDLHLRRAPLEAVVREAAEPHLDRGRTVTISDIGTGRQPQILRKPEVIHGLRNLIQNAVDFAASRVEVELDWSDTRLAIRIRDDGPGFPPSILSRIGDPFVHRRPWEETATRPGYEGMGLGLFIAKTLLERTGARLEFLNAGGAIVVVDWPADRIIAPEDEGLGDNIPFTP